MALARSDVVFSAEARRGEIIEYKTVSYWLREIADTIHTQQETVLYPIISPLRASAENTTSDPSSGEGNKVTYIKYSKSVQKKGRKLKRIFSSAIFSLIDTVLRGE